MIETSPHISVCIATYKRPVMLNRCLEALNNMEEKEFTYSIVVVDNDLHQSAFEIARDWQRRSHVAICYDVEPEQNISRARNRAVANSSGDLIAFIDDDEFPGPTWLLELFGAYKKFSVDGVLGPVIPFYEGNPPVWLVKSNLCIRSSFETGTVMNNPKYMRTGNVLFSRDILDGLETPFNPNFGRTGGEDADFFNRMLKESHSFIWCNEAPVQESVPQDRYKRMYFVRRAILRGVGEARVRSCSAAEILRSLAACSAYTVMLPFLCLTRHHLFMKYLVKDCDHIGKVLAVCGIELLKERPF